MANGPATNLTAGCVTGAAPVICTVGAALLGPTTASTQIVFVAPGRVIKVVAWNIPIGGNVSVELVDGEDCASGVAIPFAPCGPTPLAITPTARTLYLGEGHYRLTASGAMAGYLVKAMADYPAEDVNLRELQCACPCAAPAVAAPPPPPPSPQLVNGSQPSWFSMVGAGDDTLNTNFNQAGFCQAVSDCIIPLTVNQGLPGYSFNTTTETLNLPNWATVSGLGAVTVTPGAATNGVVNYTVSLNPCAVLTAISTGTSAAGDTLAAVGADGSCKRIPLPVMHPAMTVNQGTPTYSFDALTQTLNLPNFTRVSPGVGTTVIATPANNGVVTYAVNVDACAVIAAIPAGGAAAGDTIAALAADGSCKRIPTPTPQSPPIAAATCEKPFTILGRDAAGVTKFYPAKPATQVLTTGIIVNVLPTGSIAENPSYPTYAQSSVNTTTIAATTHDLEVYVNYRAAIVLNQEDADSWVSEINFQVNGGGFNPGLQANLKGDINVGTAVLANDSTRLLGVIPCGTSMTIDTYQRFYLLNATNDPAQNSGTATIGDIRQPNAPSAPSYMWYDGTFTVKAV